MLGDEGRDHVCSQHVMIAERLSHITSGSYKAYRIALEEMGASTRGEQGDLLRSLQLMRLLVRLRASRGTASNACPRFSTQSLKARLLFFTSLGAQRKN